jgi:CheY-like chemotaxis protein
MALTALVVDDNPLALRLSRAVLEKEGIRVLEVARWPEVSDIFYREEIDLVLCDVNMPGIQGDKLVEILKQTRRGRKVPVLLVSNLSADILREKAKNAGADDWIQKPLTGEVLREKLERLALRPRKVTG